MSALIAIQDAMQDWLLQGDAGLAALVDAGDATIACVIYADAYRLRLVEVLGNDFLATKAALGDAWTMRLARPITCRRTPPRSPRCDHSAMPRGLTGVARGRAERPVATARASNGRRAECFDAADAPTLDIGHVARTARRCVVGAACCACNLRAPAPCDCNAPALVEALALGATLSALAWQAQPRHMVLWRQQGEVQWRRLDADERLAAGAIAAGEPVRCNQRTLRITCTATAFARRHSLKRWLADGLLAAP